MDKEGIQWKVDDFHPTARLRALHKEKAINAKDAARIEAFINRYIVEESLVKDLNHIEMMSGKRKQEKQMKNQQKDRMSCNDFDWYEMLDDGTLEKQRVAILTTISYH